MGFGQYSAGGGVKRTKADMLPFAGDDVASSRKGGHNRLHFTRTDGSQGFILHETVIANLSADGSRLTLSDGGWHSLTTKSAWGDAIRAFGLQIRTFYPADWGSETHEGVKGYWYAGGGRIGYPGKAERSVTYIVTRDASGVSFKCAADVALDHPMIRADVDTGEGGNFAVRFTGTEIVSEAGVKVRCTPFKALVTLLRVDALMRECKGMMTLRGQALYDFNFEAFGFTIHPGQSARVTMIGCHSFRTDDIRAAMRRIGNEHPSVLKSARAFVRKHPLDYGVKTWRAQQQARSVEPEPGGLGKRSDDNAARMSVARRLRGSPGLDAVYLARFAGASSLKA